MSSTQTLPSPDEINALGAALDDLLARFHAAEDGRSLGELKAAGWDEAMEAMTRFRLADRMY